MDKITWIWRLFEFPANIYFSAISEKAKCQNKKPGGQASAAVLGPCVSVFFSVFHVFSKQTLISRKDKSWKKSALCQKTEIWNWKKLRIRPNRKTIVYWHLSPQCISSSRPPKMADKVRENKTFFVWIWNEEKIPRKDDFYKTFIYQNNGTFISSSIFGGHFLKNTFFHEFRYMYWHNSHGIEFDTCCFTACSLDKSRSINEDKYFNNLGHQAKSFQVFSVPMSSKLFARSFSKMSHLSSSFRISWRCENDAKEEKRNPIV